MEVFKKGDLVQIIGENQNRSLDFVGCSGEVVGDVVGEVQENWYRVMLKPYGNFSTFRVKSLKRLDVSESN